MLLGFAWIPAQAQSFDTTRTSVPKSVQAASMHATYEWLQHDYAKDDFETNDQYRHRVAQMPVDSKLRAVALTPEAYVYDAERQLLSIPLLHRPLRSKAWADVPVYVHADELGLPVEYGLSVPAGSEFGHLLARSDTSGIKLHVAPGIAAAMRERPMDCLLVFRLVPGPDSSPLWEKSNLQPAWDGGPEMYTWRYLNAEVVGLWLFDPSKKRPVMQKFAFKRSASEAGR